MVCFSFPQLSGQLKGVADTVGKGYGFPSSHSQYMTYFATFLILHLYFRHRFATTGYWIVDKLWRIALYLALILWAGSVCYSRHVHGFCKTLTAYQQRLCCLQAFLDIPHAKSDSLGSRGRRLLRNFTLHGHRTHSSSISSISFREISAGTSIAPIVDLLPFERRLGCMGGWGTRGRMAGLAETMGTTRIKQKA